MKLQKLLRHTTRNEASRKAGPEPGSNDTPATLCLPRGKEVGLPMHASLLLAWLDAPRERPHLLRACPMSMPGGNVCRGAVYGDLPGVGNSPTPARRDDPHEIVLAPANPGSQCCRRMRTLNSWATSFPGAYRSPAPWSRDVAGNRFLPVQPCPGHHPEYCAVTRDSGPCVTTFYQAPSTKLQPPAYSCNHRPTAATTGLQLQPPAYSCNHRPTAATTGLELLQPPAYSCNHRPTAAITGLQLQPPAYNCCNHRPIAATTGLQLQPLVYDCNHRPTAAATGL